MTPKQKEFVRQFCATGSAKDSYVAAFGINASKKPNIQGSKLLQHPEVKKAIEAIQGKIEVVKGNLAVIHASEKLLTLEQHMERLKDLSMKAEKESKWQAAITAEVKRGELMGFYVARSENTNHNYTISEEPMSPDEWASKYATQH